MRKIKRQIKKISGNYSLIDEPNFNLFQPRLSNTIIQEHIPRLKDILIIGYEKLIYRKPKDITIEMYNILNNRKGVFLYKRHKLFLKPG